MIYNMNKVFMVILVLFPEISKACAVCFGAQDSPMTDGMNKAIIFLLFVITSVLLGIISVVIFFYRRSKLINENIGMIQ